MKFEQRKPTLQFKDREIILKDSPELKQIGQIIRFYQNTGQLPKPEIGPQEVALWDSKARKTIRSLYDASLPGTSGQLLAGIRIAEDTLSLTRNILFAIPAIGPDDPVVNHLGYYAGTFWAFFALRELGEGWEEYQHSKIIQDAEGQRRSAARLFSGAVCFVASVSYLTGRVCSTFAVQVASAVMIAVAGVFFGIGSAFAMGISLLGALRCSRFNGRLNRYLENGQLTEVQRLQGALRFLKDSISVTTEERAELVEQIEKNHPDWSGERKVKLLEQKLFDLTETKIKHMKRRTSSKSLYLILTQADAILEKLANPNTCSEGIKDATILLCTIQKENKIKMALYILGAVAALISLCGMLVMTFLTAGSLPFILYGVAGTIYLGLTLYSIAGMFLRRDLASDKVDLGFSPSLIPHFPHVNGIS